jgi:hypothetical protein
LSVSGGGNRPARQGAAARRNDLEASAGRRRLVDPDIGVARNLGTRKATRESVTSLTLRRPEMLPPEEIAFAIKAVVKASFGAQQDELFTAVARLLGFKSTSAQLRERLSVEASRLVEREVLTDRDRVLAEPEPTRPATIKLYGIRDGTSAG